MDKDKFKGERQERDRSQRLFLQSDNSIKK
jgi:hypothetical protein